MMILRTICISTLANPLKLAIVVILSCTSIQTLYAFQDDDVSSTLVSELDGDALVKLALSHSTLTAEKTDFKAALDYLKRAVELENAQALTIMGNLHMPGLMHIDVGIPDDANQAFECASKAAGFGDSEGLFLLSECYRNGIGVEPDEERAFQLLLEAAEDGSIDAVCSILRKTINHMPEKREEAIEHIRRIADSEVSEANIILAEMHYEGRYGEKDPVRAERYLHGFISIVPEEKMSFFQPRLIDTACRALVLSADKYSRGVGIRKEDALIVVSQFSVLAMKLGYDDIDELKSIKSRSELMRVSRAVGRLERIEDTLLDIHIELAEMKLDDTVNDLYAKQKKVLKLINNLHDSDHVGGISEFKFPLFVHRVMPRETLVLISERYYGHDKGVKDILHCNHTQDVHKLRIGMLIIIPNPTQGTY